MVVEIFLGKYNFSKEVYLHTEPIYYAFIEKRRIFTGKHVFKRFVTWRITEKK